MRNEAVQPIVRTLLEYMSDRRSWRTESAHLPSSVYTDPVHLALERSTLFTTLPQAVALSPDLPQPGSVLTRETLRLPVVLTRDSDGEVHAFANVCAHRAAAVVTEARSCSRRLTCPYHSWSYGLDGSLAGVPDRGAFPGLEVPGPGLRELPSIEQDGVIWVVPDIEQAPVAPEVDLGPIADDLGSFEIAGHRFWNSHRFELALNWKLVIDTFLEPYHFASLHRDTVGPIFVGNLCHADRFGNHVREVLPRKSIADLADQPPESWDIVPHSALVYVLFPSTVFVMQVDHIETWRVAPHPTDPGRCVCDLDFYVPDVPVSESGERHWDRNWQLTLDTVDQEDFLAMAGVQRGLASGALDEVRIGANEPALGLFHAALAEAVPPRSVCV